MLHTRIPNAEIRAAILQLSETAGIASAKTLNRFQARVLCSSLAHSHPAVDLAVASALHDSATSALTTFFFIVTALGSLETIALLA